MYVSVHLPTLIARLSTRVLRLFASSLNLLFKRATSLKSNEHMTRSISNKVRVLFYMTKFDLNQKCVVVILLFLLSTQASIEHYAMYLVYI